MGDPFDLLRFVAAQDEVYATVVAELRAGCKRSHWMWFVFPQIEGLGLSDIAQRFSISSLAEARAYLAHPVLGARLRECVELVAEVEGRSVRQIFGTPDDLKLRSSMTLFAAAAPDEPIFRRVLEKYYGGNVDSLTLARLAPTDPPR